MPNKETEFILYWRDGATSRVSGADIASAMNNAGYGRGSLPALDYWEKLKDRDTQIETEKIQRE